VRFPDLHEVILTRGDVQGAERSVRSRIFVRENCVLVHPGDCHQKASTQTGKEACILQLLEWEGEGVFAWLEQMADCLSIELVEQKRRMIQMLTERRTGWT
jgi:hypothetical protein